MIETIITKITNYKETNRQLNEENTKMTLVVPMMEHLGYNPRNLDEIESEFTSDMRNNGGEKVDYSIMNNGKPFIFVEVKPLGTILEKHIGQLQRYYVSDNEVKYGILTDGQKYMFFTDDERENIMDITPYYEIDILNLTETDGEFLKLYTKENIQDEIKLETERKSFKLKIFIEKHIKDPDDDFIEYISQRVGVEVTKEKLKEILNVEVEVNSFGTSVDNIEEEITDSDEENRPDKCNSKIKYPLELEVAKKGMKAYATQLAENKLIIKKGSEICKDSNFLYDKTVKIVEQLDIQTRDNGDKLELTEDLIIENSRALRVGVSIVIGKEYNGVENWYVAGTGKSVKEYFNIGNTKETTKKPKNYNVFGKTIEFINWKKTIVNILNEIIEHDQEGFNKIKNWEFKSRFYILPEKVPADLRLYDIYELKQNEKVSLIGDAKTSKDIIEKLLKETTLPNNTVTYHY